MSYRIYQVAGWFFFIICCLPFFLYSAITGRHRQGLGQRLGVLNDAPGDDARPVRIWLHAASVGEVQVARALVAELKKLLPEAVFIVSTLTAAGWKVASRQLGGEARVIHAPLDLAGIVGRSLKAIRPAIYICLETELWPNILMAAQRQGVKLMLLNGRLSARSCRRYRLVPGLVRKLLAGFAKISVVSPLDAERFVALGAEPSQLVVNGNAKYDLATAPDMAAVAADYRRLLGVDADEPMLVTGSTHTGEEQMLIGVYMELKEKSPGLAGLVWVLAPRHLERLPEVERLLAESHISFERLSKVESHGRKTQVVLMDRMGVLASLYAAADYVFCGGSLVERGGHNIMEAAIRGRPVFYGPSMADFSDAAALLESAGAGFPVASPKELASRISYFAAHREEYAAAGRLARQAALSQQGSARRQAELVTGVLSQ